MKKKILKSLALVFCALLLVVCSIVGTFAYLTSKATVTNTFTIGNVKITMDEKDIDNSTPDKDRDTVNNFKLFPGQKYEKDPIIHVDADSEKCWLFVEITDELADIQADKTVKKQLEENGWILMAGETNVYGREASNEGGDDVTVFTELVILNSVTNEVLANYSGKTITVVAYAVQAEGFATAKAAWEAAKTELKP